MNTIINKIVKALVAMLLIVALAVPALAQTFPKGTKIYDKKGQVLGIMSSKMNLKVSGTKKIKGVECYVVKGTGSCAGQTGYIKKSDVTKTNSKSTKKSKNTKKTTTKKDPYEISDYPHPYFIDVSYAIVRDKDLNAIGKIKGGKEINILGWVKIKSKATGNKGTYAKIKYKGADGYVYADLIGRD